MYFYKIELFDDYLDENENEWVYMYTTLPLKAKNLDEAKKEFLKSINFEFSYCSLLISDKNINKEIYEIRDENTGKKTLEISDYGTNIKYKLLEKSLYDILILTKKSNYHVDKKLLKELETSKEKYTDDIAVFSDEENFAFNRRLEKINL